MNYQPPEPDDSFGNCPRCKALIEKEMLVGHGCIECTGKPAWDTHDWPQIFHHPDGYWFGVKAGWNLEAHIHQGWKGVEVSLLSEDGDWLSYDEDTTDWRNSLEQRP